MKGKRKRYPAEFKARVSNTMGVEFCIEALERASPVREAQDPSVTRSIVATTRW